MTYKAVIDTNVIISALSTGNADSATLKVLNYVADEKIIPLLNEAILKEYSEVLHRAKFKFEETHISYILNLFLEMGEWPEPIKSTELLPDPKDVIFYEISLSSSEAYLVTGNIKHFPLSTKIVTPAQMVQIIGLTER